MTQIGSITNKVLSSHKQIIENASKALENNNKVVIKDVSKSVLKVIMMAKLEQILNLE